jgi:hypothetical protein
MMHRLLHQHVESGGKLISGCQPLPISAAELMGWVRDHRPYRPARPHSEPPIYSVHNSNFPATPRLLRQRRLAI